MNGADKRKMERFDLKLPAKVALAGHEDDPPQEMTTKDVSAGGAFIHTEAPLPVGTEVRIELVLPLEELKKLEGKTAQIKVTGAVIRSNHRGMAVSFDHKFEIRPLS